MLILRAGRLVDDFRRCRLCLATTMFSSPRLQRVSFRDITSFHFREALFTSRLFRHYELPARSGDVSFEMLACWPVPDVSRDDVSPG